MNENSDTNNHADLAIGGPNAQNPVDAIGEEYRDTTEQPRIVGLNHVAIEVGNIEDALAFYDNIFAIKLRGRTDGMAFVDFGDQFIALAETETRAAQGDEEAPSAHLGVVVDNPDAVRQRLGNLGIAVLPGAFLDFLDPWGNRIQIVGYSDVQFIKSRDVLRAMGLSHLTKSQEAIDELRGKGVEIPADLVAPHSISS